jgi:hypothetical protein
MGGSFTEPHNRLPGYPLLLALFGGAEAAQNRYLFFFQLVVHCLGAGLLAAMLKRLGVSVVLCAAFCAVLLLPPFVDTAAFVLTESVTGFLLAGLLYCVVRWLLLGAPAYAWLAALLGAAVFMVKPVYMLLAPCLAATLYLTRPRKASLPWALCLATPSFLACALIVGINYKAFDYAGLTPKTGFMLFTRTLTFLEEIPDRDSEVREVLIRNRDRSLTVRGSSHTATQFMWEGGLRELLETTGKSKAALSQDMLQLNLRLIAAAPLEYAATVGRSITDLWFPAATRVSFFGSRYLQLAWALLHLSIVAMYFSALAYGLARLIVLVAGRPSLLASPGLHPSTGLVEFLLHVTIWYTCIVSAAVEVGEPRYMRPVLPLVAAATVLFVVRWMDLRRAQRSTSSSSMA